MTTFLIVAGCNLVSCGYVACVVRRALRIVAADAAAE